MGCIIIPLLLLALISGVFLYLRSRASNHLTVPQGTVAFIRATPDDTAPLLARFGAGRTLEISGRSADWQWLEVVLWDGRHGWTRRPLDILVWRIDARPTTPTPAPIPPHVVTPVRETMLTIPASAFTMGSPPGLGEDDERPAHVVNVSAFAIDRTEVTVGQYWRCVAAGACDPPTRDASPGETHYLNDPIFDNHPVVNVSWRAAKHYCIWRNKRLPTEAEWELAASWNSEKKAKLIWPWGNSAHRGRANVGHTSLHKPAPVGSFPTDLSPAGILDMGGNVSEWILDWYKVDYYRVSATTNPAGPTHRRGAGTGRVVRGGSFADVLDEARTANRRYQAAAYGYPSVGFRCARDR